MASLTFRSTFLAKTLLVCLSVMLAATGFVAQVEAQTLKQIYFVPIDEDQIRSWADAVNTGSTSAPDNITIHTVVSVTGTADGTTVYYDHWEDGLEADLANPVQASTQTFIVNQGQFLVIDVAGGDGDDIVLPEAAPFPDPLLHDGRDRIGATELIAVTRVGWRLEESTLLAGAVEVFPTSEWGTRYVAPIGEDVTVDTQEFEYVSMSVMTDELGALIEIDRGGDGSVDETRALGPGESTLIENINIGDVVESSDPFQADLITGNLGSNFEGRWIHLVPFEDWGDSYYTPVGSPAATGDPTGIFLFNPGASALTVTAETQSGTTPVNVPAGGVSYFQMPIGSAGRFFTAGEEPFFALSTIDNSTTHDWGFTVLPEQALTTELVLGFAPGQDPTSTPFTENSSPIWVTAVAPTTISVDFENDGVVDQTFPITALESLQIRDTSDGDQSGTRVFTTDGTLITGAWGQDPDTASGGSPALDAGTTVAPVPALAIVKTGTLIEDLNGDGGINVGERVRFVIEVTNLSVTTVFSVTVDDFDLDSAVTYNADSTEVDGVEQADDMVGATIFPLDEGGLNIGDMAAGQTVELRFTVTVNSLPPSGVIVNQVEARSDGLATVRDQVELPVDPPDLSITKASDAVGNVVPGQTISYTVVVTNDGVARQTGLKVLDPLPQGTGYVAESTSAQGPGFSESATSLENTSSNAISNGGCTTHTYNVTGSGTVTDVDLGVNLGTPDRGDFEATLSSPLTTSVVVIAGDTSGDSADNYDLLLDDSSSNSINDGDNDSTSSPFYDRAASPSNPLSAFNGENGQGVWTLEICDLVGGDGDLGTLNRSRLDLTTSQSGTVTKTNDPLSPPLLIDGAPPNLVLAPDQFFLDPADSLTITYQVQVDDPLDVNVSTIDNTAVATSIQTPEGVEATVIDPVSPGGTIGDLVWFDIDGDNVQDLGEPGLSGVTVELYDPGPDGVPGGGDDILLDTDTTDGNGNYLFDFLAPGDYFVNVVDATLPPGLGPSPGTMDPSDVVTIVFEDVFLDVDFGYTNADPNTAVLGDFVWSDANADGIQDAGEVGVGGVLVNLIDLGPDGVPGGGDDSVVATTTTAPNGIYFFAGVDPGDYQIEIDSTNFDPGGPLEGAVATVGPESEGGTLSSPVTANAGDVNLDIDFGFDLPNDYAISDVFWCDVDADGVFDSTEFPLAGVTVNLANGVGDVVSTITAGDGTINFSGVQPGDYTILVTDLFGVLTPFGGTTIPAVTRELAVTVVDADVVGINFGYDTNLVLTPAVEIVKSSDAGASAALDDVITYTYDVTNIGDVTLTDVTVTDPHSGLSAIVCVPAQPAVLAVGATMQCTATYTVVQADVDVGQIDNTGTVTAEGPCGDPDGSGDNVTDSDSVSIPVVGNPGLGLVKSFLSNADEDGSGDVTLGDTLTYQFVATNTGDVSLTNVTISDPLPGLSALTCAPTQPSTLAPGASMTCTATYVVTQADVDAGQILNTATADSDETDPVTDPETVPVTQNPGLGLDKTLQGNADEDESGDVTLGDTLTYQFVATNTGDVTLTNVTISDPLPGLSALSCTPTQPATLAPGASMTCTATYVVTQADVDAGQILNTATADSDETDPVTDPETVPTAQNPGLSLDKSLSSNADEDGSGSVSLNDTLTYQFVATNTGDVTLTNVTISDPLPGLSALTCAPTQPSTLAPGASMTCTATYVVTQTDVDNGQIDNTATADSDQTGPETDSETVPVAQNPDLTLVKSLLANADEDASGTVTLGDTLTYQFVATNSGGVTLTNVTIADPLPGLSALTCVPTQPATLTSGASMTCTATYVVTQADVDAGQVVNTATADSDQTDPVTDPEIVPAVGSPDIDLVKDGTLDTGGDGGADPGDVINYTFQVTNTGNVTLINIAVTDPLVAAITCPSGNPIPLLAPGASETCTGSYAINQTDIDAGQRDNTATATGTPPAGPDVSDTDDHSEPLPPAPPANPCTGEAFIVQNVNAQLTQIDQSVSPFEFINIGVPAGTEYNAMGFRRTDGLLYAVELSSAGNIQIIRIDRDGNVFGLGRPALLPPGPRFDAGDISSDGTTMYITTVNQPLYALDLTALPTLPPVTEIPKTGDNGFVFDWAYNPTNGLLYGGDSTGGQMAVLNPTTGVRTDVNLVDTGLGTLPSGTSFGGSWFNVAGQLFLYRNNGAIYEIDLSVPTIVDIQTGPGSSRNDAASCIQDVVGAAKQMSVTTDGLPETLTIDYVFENISTADDLFNLSSIDDLTAVFGVHGVDWTFTSISSSPAIFANSSYDGHTDFELINRSPTQTLLSGSTATVSVEIEILTLDNLNGDGEFCNQVQVIAETADGTVFGDVSTDGNDPDPDGNGSPDERDLACVGFVQPEFALDLVKGLQSNTDEDGSGDVSEGDTLTYSFVATNTGTSALTNVTISDPLPGLSALSCTPTQPASLAPGATLSCTATYVVTAADVAAGVINNTATASSNEAPDDSDSESVPVPNPALDLVKSLQGNADEDSSSNVTEGDTLTYSFVATNTGTANLTNVSISDPLPGLSALVCVPTQPATLSPGQALSCTATYVVTAADVAAGVINNTATASSDQTPDDSDSETVPVAQASMNLVKSLQSNADEDGSGTVTENDTLTYSFVVTNTGTTTLTNVSISDPLPGLSALSCTPTQPTTLAPGATLSCTATYVVTAADVTAGVINNTATASSDETPDDSDSETVPVVQPVSMSLVKSLQSNADEDGSGDVSVGDTLTYSFVATNTGAATLTNVSISDPLPGLSALSCTPTQPATLAPGATLSCTATYVVTQTDVDAGVINNTATASSDETPDETDTETVPVAQNPDLSLLKQLLANNDEDGSGSVTEGDTLTYRFVASNTGDVTLTNVTISDPLPGLSALNCAPAQPSTLAPGEFMQCTAAYTVTAADVAAGVINNTATASSDETPDDTDTETVPVVDPPSMNLVKSLQSNADEDGSGTVTEGDTLTYSFVVTNTGNVTLNNVSISDPLPGLSALSCTPTQPATLTAGATLACTATYVVTAADATAGVINNTATASSDETPDDTDSETVPVVSDGPEPFPCTGEAYIVQNLNAELTQIDQSVSPFVFLPVGGPTGIEINNLAFRQSDGLLYGVELSSTGATQIVQIDANGTVFGLGLPAGLPTNLRFDGGDINGDTFYLNRSGSGSLYRVDLNTFTVTSVAITGNVGIVFDWAVNPTNGLLYGGDQSNGQMAILDPATGVRTDVSLVDTGLGTLPAGTAFGGAWFNANGQLFLYRNNGAIYEIDLSVPTIVDIQLGPGSTRNDAAACVQSVLGAAKRMTTTNDGLPETVTIDYVFENFSLGEDLFNMSGVDDLSTVFGTPGVDWTFTSISSVPASFANPSFDGDTDIEMINQAPTQDLLAGSIATITVVLELLTLDAINPDNEFCNQVLVTGENAAGTIFGDVSTDGSDPDPNGDGIPDERELACIGFTPTPDMNLVKSLQSNADEDGSGNVSEGDTLTYSFVVTNTGSVTLTNVSISDPLPGLSALSCVPTQPATLAPGATLSCTATYVVTAADVVAGAINNTATASSDQTPDDQDTETVPVVDPAAMNLVKSLQSNADEDASGDVSEGDTLTYSFVVTNTGTVTLTNVSIVDPLPGLSALSCTPAQPATLAPAATLSCTATYVVTAADAAAGVINNTATASSDQTPDDTDTETVPVIDDIPVPFPCTGEAYIIQNLNAELTQIDQSVSPFVFIPVGGPTGIEINNLAFRQSDGLLYGVELNTTGNTQIVTIDANGTVVGLGRPAGLPANLRFDGGDIAGDTFYLNRSGSGTLYRVDLNSFTFTSVPIAGATGTVFDWAVNPADGLLYGGDHINGQLAALDPATGVRTDVFLVDTGLGTLPTGTSYGGAWFDATGRLFLYRNNGAIYEIDVSVPTVVDIQLGPGSSRNDAAACIQSVLGAAKQMTTTNDGLPETVTIDYVFENFSLGEDLFNMSGVDDLTAVFGVPGVDWTFTSISSVPASFANPSFDGDTDIEMINQAPTQSLLAGSSASITIVLELLTLDAINPDNEFCNQVVVTGENAAGTIFGDVSADGSDPDPNGDGIPDERELACIDFDPTPSMSLVKSLSGNADEDGSGDVSEGDTLTYSFVATNTGPVDLTGVTITDPLPGLSALTCVPTQPATLTPGSTLTCTATYVVTAADVTAGVINNTATASSNETPDEQDSETVPVPQPAMNLVKSLQGNADEDGSGDISVNDTLTYSFVVTNTGTATLTNVTISDPLPGLSALSCVPTQPATLAPAATLSCTATYVVTAADIIAGQITNTATASSDQTPDDQDTVIVPPPAGSMTLVKNGTLDVGSEPGTIQLVKTGTLDQGADAESTPGDLINYTFEVTNPGPTPLTNITVSDPLVPVITCPSGNPIPALAVGASETCTGSYAITQADIDAGVRDNTATASGFDTGGNPVSDDDTHSETIPAGGFVCTGEAFIIQNINADLTQVDQSVSPFVFVPLAGPLGTEINNLGFRITDGLLYGVELSSAGNIQIVSVAADGTVTGLGRPAGLPAGPRFDAGDVSPDGSTMYITTVNRPLYVLDLSAPPLLPPVTEIPITGSTGFVFDWTASPIDGLLYGGDSTNGQLAILDPTTGVRTDVNLVDTGLGTLPRGTSFGGAWFNNLGELFLYRNNGQIFTIDLAVPTITNIQTGPGSSRNDGAACIPPLPFADLVGLPDKDHVDGIADPGDLINYTFEVTNTGSVPLTNVLISDPLVPVITCPSGNPIPTLAVGASETCTGSYAITQADIDAGVVNNTAFADSDETGPVQDTHSEPIPQTSGLDLVKTGALDQGADATSTVGDLINYTFEVTNTGFVTLTNVLVSDPLVPTITCPSGNPIPALAVGASETCTGSYAITQADIDAEVRDNTATANSDQAGPVQDTHSEPIPVGDSFVCTGDAFIVQNINAELTQIDQSVSPFVFVPVGLPTGVELNNLGFRITDGLMYAVELNSSGNTQIVQIDASGNVTGLGRPAGLPANLRFDAGDVSPDGTTMYINTVNRPLYVLDLTSVPALPAVTQVNITGANGFVFDWAVSPIDGLLYGGDSSQSQLAILDPTTGVRTDVAVEGCQPFGPDCAATGLPGGTAYGGAWFDNTGTLFLYRNTGAIYEIDLNGGGPGVPRVVRTQIGPGSSRNDGAACIPPLP